DKSFIQQQITHRSFEPFIRAIQAQISPCCNCIIAGGIDTTEILAQITPFDFHALQGCLWPAVPINQITTLVQR
ncbi:TPA: EAL domain-containing protein, partial [Escherichia coli]|nr:EAL domain-containing protein [Escherichia coli]